MVICSCLRIIFYTKMIASFPEICAIWDSEEFIEETLVPLAKASEGGWIFREFFKCTNYVTDIVEPIKKYVAENNIHFEQ